MIIKGIENITQLRQRLCNVFVQVEAGHMMPSKASELNNTAGKIISTCTLELEKARLCKSTPKVAFLD